MTIWKRTPEQKELWKEMAIALRDPTKMSKRVSDILTPPLIKPGKFRNLPVKGNEEAPVNSIKR